MIDGNKKQPCLIGKIVTLKRLHEEFFEEYHAMFSPLVRERLGIPPTSELQQTIDFLKACMCDPQHLMFFCIFDNQTHKLIGSIVVRSVDHPNGQLGSWVNENFWGGGRYQEALSLLLMYYFESTDEHAIFAFVAADNVRSLKAHQKMGFMIDQITQQSHCCGSDKNSYKIIFTRELLKG